MTVKKIIKGLTMVELFSGSGIISKEFQNLGFKIFQIDIRERKSVCEPNLKKDILQVRLSDIPFKKVDIIWASPPCDIFSKASSNFHIDKLGNPKTEKALEHLKILKKTLILIEKINPTYFFIENPSGKMKFNRDMIRFLIRNNAMIKQLDYICYGFELRKPTNIFTNMLGINFKNLSGKKQNLSKDKPSKIFNNLSKCQRQKIPKLLAVEVANYCKEVFLK
jgi:site-specific DNA-cytosine methylase